MKVLYVQLTDDQHKALKLKAIDKGVSLSEYIRQVITIKLNKSEKGLTYGVSK